MNEIFEDLKNGMLSKEVCEKYNITSKELNDLTRTKTFPFPTVCDYLNSNPDIKQKFIDIYNNSSSAKNTIEVLNKSNLLPMKIDGRRLSEFRSFLNLKPYMPENAYKSDSDRTKGYIIRNIKLSAKRRGLEFNLDYTDLELPKYCPILGIELFYGRTNHYNKLNHATVDRIDNSKGYVKGNVIIISRLANMMKTCATIEQIQKFNTTMPILINYYKTHGVLGALSEMFNTNVEHFEGSSR